jgi:hypothetical protein
MRHIAILLAALAAAPCSNARWLLQDPSLVTPTPTLPDPGALPTMPIDQPLVQPPVEQPLVEQPLPDMPQTQPAVIGDPSISEVIQQWNCDGMALNAWVLPVCAYRAEDGADPVDVTMGRCAHASTPSNAAPATLQPAQLLHGGVYVAWARGLGHYAG